MEYYNGILCISGKELIRTESNPNGIISLDIYRQLAYVRKKLKIQKRGGGEENPVLVTYDSLPPKYKLMAKERHGDPEVESQKEGIMKILEHDKDAIAFFKNYRVSYDDDNERGLPEDIQTIYSNNAAVLNALKKKWDEHLLYSRSQSKRPLSGKFWSRSVAAVQNLPGEWRCDLPKSPKRLRRKLEDYIVYGYEEILSGKWGNQNKRVINDEVGEWLVAEWSAHVPRKVVSIEKLHALYNQKAEEVNRTAGKSLWKEIKSSLAIRDYLYRPDIKEQWYAARYGELNYKEEYVRQHKTHLPSMRDSLWYSDGTKLNFYYQDADGNTKTANVYEVMDVYSECFLGYHISRTEDFEAQFHAFKMAVQTSKCKPYELKYDNQGGHKKLEAGSFLGNISRHSIRTAPYNGRSKTIESAFGRFQEEYLKEEWYFTGQNIKAKKKESRENMEMILANLKNLPTLEKVKQVYLEKRKAWNNSPHPATGIPRIEMYRSSINEKVEAVDVLDMITMFGITPKLPSTYRSSGITIEVKRQKYEYEVLDANGMPDNGFMRRNIGRKFFVRYDPADMDVVSLYEKDASGLRFITVAHPYRKVQRNLQEQTRDDMQFIRQMEIINKLQRIANVKNSNELLEKYNLHPNQHGLNAPKIKGINMRKKPVDIGEIQKEVSNMTAIEEEKKAIRKALKKAGKAEKQMQAQEAEDKDDFYKERIKLLESNFS